MNQIIEYVLTNVVCIRLLVENYKDSDQPERFVYSQVFPFEYVPDTIEHGQTFICCDVDVQKSLNKTFLIPVLYVWVFTHKSKMKLPKGGVRVDRLCSEIAKAVNGSRCYGLGEMDLYAVKRFAPVTDYQGKVMTFQAKDFNRVSPTGKHVPTNRKTG